MEMTIKFKAFGQTDKVPKALWTDIHKIVYEAMTETMLKKGFTMKKHPDKAKDTQGLIQYIKKTNNKTKK